MHKNVIKIEIPEGFEIDSLDKDNQQILIKEKPKPIKERVKSFADVLKHHSIKEQDFKITCQQLETDEIAYRQVKLIVSVLNEGWQPNWEDDTESKYYPWFNMGSSSGVGFSFNDFDCWLTRSVCGSRLCFKSRDLAVYAGQQFTEIYKQFLTLNN